MLVLRIVLFFSSCFFFFIFFVMIRRPPRSTLDGSSAASDVYKRQGHGPGDAARHRVDHGVAA